MKSLLCRIIAIGSMLALAGAVSAPGATIAPGIQAAQESATPVIGLKVGDKIPELRGTDQFGKERDFENLRGPNGLVLLFFRSADW